MAKRKAGINDIVFELDNDDIEISSDDDSKESKKGRFGAENIKKSCENKNNSDRECIEVISIDSAEEVFIETEPRCKVNNGGKIPSETKSIKSTINVISGSKNIQEKQLIKDNCRKSEKDCLNTITFDNTIIVDSPASNSDLGVVGFESRTPLISVRFKDNSLANAYKKKLKEFLINLLKSRCDEKVIDTHESDNELDIWSEDLVDVNCNEEDISNAIDDGLFFVDTVPCDNHHIEIPKYSQVSTVISNNFEKESPPTTLRRRQTCFNCDGDHQLRDCALPRDNYRIAEKRKALPVKMGRYHVEDDQKYGHLVPGRISGSLRNALGLKRYELPLHIYRMRLLGYPPGWLEEARISHSGITMFDSTGTAIQDPEEEEGEVCEAGSKDKFDIKKILDFPGFNVTASSQYVEESHLFGLPPMSEQDSKMLMLQTLAPNAMKAYKRKKLLLFPTANNTSSYGQAEMELDSDDEVIFPLNPPLPDVPPPTAPPPPPPLPHPDEKVKHDSSDKELNNKRKKCLEKLESNNTEAHSSNRDRRESDKKIDSEMSSDVEVIEVIQLKEIPIPGDFIIIDEDLDSSSLTSSGRESPSLDDLENKKNLLLSALKSPNVDATIDLSESTETEANVNAEDTGSIEINKSTETLDEKLPTDKKNEDDIDNKNEDDADNKSDNSVDSRISINVTESLIANNEEVVISPLQKDTIVEKTQHIDKEENTSKDNVNNDKDLNELETLEPVEVATSINKDNDEEIEKQCNEISVIPSGSQVDDSNNSTKTTNTKTGHVKTTLYGTPVINVASSYMKLPSEDKFAKDICDVINFENLPNSTGKFRQINTLLKKVKSVVDKIQES